MNNLNPTFNGSARAAIALQHSQTNKSDGESTVTLQSSIKRKFTKHESRDKYHEKFHDERLYQKLVECNPEIKNYPIKKL